MASPILPAQPILPHHKYPAQPILPYHYNYPAQPIPPHHNQDPGAGLASTANTPKQAVLATANDGGQGYLNGAEASGTARATHCPAPRYDERQASASTTLLVNLLRELWRVVAGIKAMTESPSIAALFN